MTALRKTSIVTSLAFNDYIILGGDNLLAVIFNKKMTEVYTAEDIYCLCKENDNHIIVGEDNGYLSIVKINNASS